MKTYSKRILALLLCAIMIISSVAVFSSCSEEPEKGTQEKLESDYVAMTNGFTEAKVVDEKSALDAVATVAEELGISDVEKELKVSDVNKVDEDSYYRMQQYYNGIPVYGKTVVLSADAEGNVTALTANSIRIEDDLDTTPTVTQDVINESIKEYFSTVVGVEDTSELVINDVKKENLYLYETEGDNVLLVYLIPAGFYEFLVDADTGKIVYVIQTILEDQSATCYNSDKTIKFDGYYYDATKLYTAYDSEREITIYNYLGNNSQQVFNFGVKLESQDNLFGNVVGGNTKEKDQEYDEGVTFINNISQIYDYFNIRFSETAYGELIACYNDGYYSGENALGGRTSNFKGYVSFGSVTGVEKLDTMAHEYTHVVTRKNVNWQSIPAWSQQTNESGAINEAYSDIFGEIIESYMNNKEPDWKHGDRIICDPMSNNYPAKVGDRPFESIRSRDGSIKWGMPVGNGYYTDYSHGFSTIISHAAYLMWNGIDGTESQKIDAEVLAALWYRAMLLLQSDATFSQCANAVILSAQQMNSCLLLTDSQVTCVEQAFANVGITAVDNSYSPVLNGSTIYALDATEEKSYDNYHLLIQKVDLSTLKKETVFEIDVKDDKGYTLNLKDGSYIVTVTDNAENGSKNAYEKKINVYSENGSGATLQKVYIHTDFIKAVPVNSFTIPEEMVITLGELNVIEPEIVPEGATDYTIEWSSSDESVATVAPTGEAGIITSLAKGTTTITAKLTSGGKTITKTTNLRVASKGRDTILVLDVSGSMYGTPMEEMKKSAIQFCEDLLKDEYNNRVGLVFYDSSVTTVNLTDDLNQLIYEIEAISDRGMTNMEAGLATADVMMQNQGKPDAIKNIVIMADGLPNDGKTSYSNSMPNGSYYGAYTDISYANAVIDTAKDMMTRYNMYSLGFFHSLYSEEKDFGVALMQQLTNQEEGYHQVDNAEDLQFAFGDISENINVGSKIVINIACPVDVEVSYGGEKLSSAADSYCDSTSFGTLQVLGKDKDIKVVSLDDDKEYEVTLTGTGEGTMDYSVCYFDENEKRSDYRSFESVPITMTTVITSNTNNDEEITLNIDEDGDGEVDTIWTALENSVGEITFQKNPPKLEDSSGNASTLVIVLVIVAIIVIAGCTIGIIVAVSFKGKNKKSEEDIIPIKESVPANPSEDTQTEDDSILNMGVIQITSGPMNGFSVSIRDGETLYLGRDSKFANIVFTEEYTKISRLHCTVTYNAEGNKYYVTDCSRNGTFLISRKRLEKGKRTPLNSNTILILANDSCTILLG